MKGPCRPSRQEDLPQLKTLWQVCFGDEPDYIGHYFATYYRPERVLVLETADGIASMLLTFPNTLILKDGSSCPACYIYAFCTRPDQQGKGYGRLLLAYAQERAALAGCGAAMMVPGEGSLFDFYATLGYETAFFHREFSLSRGKPGDQIPQLCDGAAYAAQRERCLAGLCHTAYPTEVLEYQRSLCQNAGGGLYQWAGGVAAVEVDGDVLLCKELLSRHIPEDVSSLLALLGLEQAVIRLPAGPGSVAKRFGVVKWLIPGLGQNWDRETGYLAFAFD